MGPYVVACITTYVEYGHSLSPLGGKWLNVYIGLYIFKTFVKMSRNAV